jgi:GrpB-like predicted nucleotidyltransferase (UPF0157 family)
MRKKKIIGLQRRKVQLSHYKPEWKELYKKERKLLRSSIGKYILDIQHVGATSIPGVVAKPIIDIAIGVKSLSIVKRLIKPLKELGYEYKGTAGVPGRHFFPKGSERNRTHYLHMERLGSKNWKNHILFRDYLRRHKEAVKEYNKLKEKLAKEYKNERESYTAKKSVFIQKILKKAKIK